MSARKNVVEEPPQFTPEQMAEAAASIPAVVENVQSAAERIEQIEAAQPTGDEEPAAAAAPAAIPDAETAFKLRFRNAC